MPKSTNYEIKTTLAVDGEKEFKAAMDAANKSMRVSDSEMKKLEAAYNAGGEKMDYYTGRARVLNREAEQQEAIVEALRKAVAEAGKMFGEASSKVQDYQIKLNKAEAKQIDLAKAAQEANRDLEALGRDSGKIGRQIENGIGDAAEKSAEELDSMFAKVQKDVNALKTSVGFEVATEVGGFVVNAVQGVMGFVEENQELNRQMAIAKYNIEKYDFDWTKSLELVTRAAAITGNQEGALEAINNLVSTQVTNEELIEAAMEGILGVYLTTGGSLSLESLAEDLRASVTSKKPTGTYAEVLEELIQGIVIEDVEKALGATESAEEALQLATAYLTQAGYQSTTKSFEEQNKQLLENLAKEQRLALAWATLAERVEPTVGKLTDAAISIVEGMTTTIDTIDQLKDNAKKQIETGTTGAELIQNSGITMDDLKPDFIDKMVEWRKNFYEKLYEKLMVPVDILENWLFPSAGAETLHTEELNDYGFRAMMEINNGMMQAANEEVTAAQAAVATTIAQMQTEEQLEAAFEAGRNAMIAFGNGIAEGAGVPISNVRTMVNQINAMLSAMASPAYGLGWGGITGGNISLYMDGQKVGGLVAGGVSSALGRRVATKMTIK